MNFLSHYYFNRFADDELLVAGSVLPDLVRNADSSIKIHPEKDPVMLYKNNRSVFRGWKQHIQIDGIFHESDFFKTYTKQLRLAIEPILKGTPFKTFFAAHISLELLIDYLLIKHKKVNVHSFYNELEKAQVTQLISFLQNTGKVSPVQLSRFIRFYHTFCQNAYLHSYQNISGIGYAVVQICKRIWPGSTITREQEKQISVLFEQYALYMDTSYNTILSEIQAKLADTQE